MRRLITLPIAVLLLGCQTPLHLCTDSRVSMDQMPAVAPGQLHEMPLRSNCRADLKVAVIDVDGLLLNTDMVGVYSQGENPVALFREKLEQAAGDPCVRAVVLRINSYGGGVTASDMMWHDLLAFKSRTHLPVIACLMDVATGGGYYLATAADQIVAHPTTVTGGLGVILNLYNLHDFMAQFNILGMPIRAGTHTDLGSPVRSLDESSRKLLQAMADQFQARFREVVAQTRPQHDPAQVDDFDGRIFTADQALQRKLIDSIGYLDEAIAAAKQMAGTPWAQVVLYHRGSDPVRTVYSVTPNIPIQATVFPLSVPGLDRTKLPTFLYIWQPDPTMERLSGK
jgi:protease-4